MAVGCGAKCSKFILVLFNILVLLTGIAILGVGIWLLVDEDASKYFDIIREDHADGLARGACIVLIIVGTVAMIISFLGCCGAMKESSCMLMTYAIIMAILLILQIAAGIAGVVFRNDIEDNLEKSMNDTVQNKYGEPNNDELTESWDFMQVEFQCCGAVNGPSDWETSKWVAKHQNQSVPETCCVLLNNDYINPQPKNPALCQFYGTNTSHPEAPNYVSTKGCSPAFHDWVKDHVAIIIGIAFGLAVIQLAAVLFACLLKNNMYKVDYEYV